MPIPLTVQVTGPIAPSATSDTYPTHFATYGFGGKHEVADYTELNGIPDERRVAYMMSTVASDGKYWELNPGPWVHNISDWTQLSIGAGSGTNYTSIALTNAVPVVVDTVPVQTVGDVTWTVVIANATTRARERWVISATHDGDLSNDAVSVDYNVGGRGPDSGHTIIVDLNGTGASQTFRLVITASGTGWTAYYRKLESVTL